MEEHSSWSGRRPRHWPGGGGVALADPCCAGGARGCRPSSQWSVVAQTPWPGGARDCRPPARWAAWLQTLGQVRRHGCKALVCLWVRAGVKAKGWCVGGEEGTALPGASSPREYGGNSLWFEVTGFLWYRGYLDAMLNWLPRGRAERKKKAWQGPVRMLFWRERVVGVGEWVVRCWRYFRYIPSGLNVEYVRRERQVKATQNFGPTLEVRTSTEAGEAWRGIGGQGVGPKSQAGLPLVVKWNYDI